MFLRISIMLAAGALPLAGQALFLRYNKLAVFFLQFLIGALLLLGYAVSFCLNEPAVLV